MLVLEVYRDLNIGQIRQGHQNIFLLCVYLDAHALLGGQNLKAALSTLTDGDVEESCCLVIEGLELHVHFDDACVNLRQEGYLVGGHSIVCDFKRLQSHCRILFIVVDNLSRADLARVPTVAALADTVSI